MYPDEFFPPYVLGSLYIIPARLLGCLVKRTSEVSFISIEDVYVTGLLRSKCPDIELTFVPERLVLQEVLLMIKKDIINLCFSSPDPLTCSEMTDKRMIVMATGNQSVQIVHQCKRSGEKISNV